MAFRALIQRQLAQAFNTIGDLAESVNIATEAPGDYDFTTGARTAGTVSTVQVPATIEVTTRDENGEAIAPATLMSIPTHLITVTINEYTRVTRPDASIWEVVSFTDDGFITILTIRRAAA